MGLCWGAPPQGRGQSQGPAPGDGSPVAALAQHPTWAPWPLPPLSVQDAAAFHLSYPLSALLPS